MKDGKCALFAAWNLVAQETCTLAHLIKNGADSVAQNILAPLESLLNERKLNRKSFGDEHSKLTADVDKVS